MAAVLAVPLPAMVAYADAVPGNPGAISAEDHQFAYHQLNVLGTSLDLKLVSANQAEADACEQTILQEIERLRGILSTYDPQSEISRLQANLATDAIAVSDELHTVLLDYQQWARQIERQRLFSPIGRIARISGKRRKKKGTIPTDAELAPFLAKIRQSAYVTPISGNEIVRKGSQPLNVDSLGKGFIVQKAAATARFKHPTVTGILLNIGGDITALGFSTLPEIKPPKPWRITRD